MSAPAQSPLFKLATRPKHVFPLGGERYIKADRTRDQPARVERVCAGCGAVKITVLLSDGASGYRMWRRAREEIERADDPGCGEASS